MTIDFRGTLGLVVGVARAALEAAAFLLSAAGCGIIGDVVIVDGGFHVMGA